MVKDVPGNGKGADSSGLELKFTSDAIEVRAMDRAGEVLGHFSVLPDGSIKEHSSKLEAMEL